MSILASVMATLGAPSITVDADWGAVTPSASPNVSAQRTFTCPGGTGTIRFAISVVPTGTLEYQLNAAAYATVVDVGTVAVATSDTLRFRLTNGLEADTALVQVYDNATGVFVGACELTVT